MSVSNTAHVQCPACNKAHDIVFRLEPELLPRQAREDGYRYRGRCQETRQNLLMKFGLRARAELKIESKARPVEVTRGD